jgi:hypothetical protein
VPQVVVAEAAYLVGKLAGYAAEAPFVREAAGAGFDLHSPIWASARWTPR